MSCQTYAILRLSRRACVSGSRSRRNGAARGPTSCTVHAEVSCEPLISLASVFFFSSRRRHTRFKCDWSSDVCSSDLDAAIPEFTAHSELRLQDARHPVLEDKLRRENRAIVPMSLALGGDERVLVISEIGRASCRGRV